MRAWELTLLSGNTSATASFNGTPWNGQVLLVGQLVSKQNLSRELAMNRIRDALQKGGMESRL
jgi:hypothetical protein